MAVTISTILLFTTILVAEVQVMVVRPTIDQQRNIPAGVPLKDRVADETTFGYRIPSFVITNQCTLPTFSERRHELHDHAQNDIVVKRSTNSRQT